MCRYAMVSYKPHYACFNCRKTFKRRLMNDINRGEKSAQEAKCPECGDLMANMGLDFESPKKDDLKKWEHIKSLYTVGIAFHSCGCSGPGYIPNSKEKLLEYFEDTKEKYLKNIDFWRTRKEPTTKNENHLDREKNWTQFGPFSFLPKKEIIKNQDGIDFWLAKVKEIEGKISLIK